MLSQIRLIEITHIQMAALLSGINRMLYFLSPKLLLFSICALYATLSKGTLNPERVFVTMTLLNSVRIPRISTYLSESLGSDRKIANCGSKLNNYFCCFGSLKVPYDVGSPLASVRYAGKGFTRVSSTNPEVPPAWGESSWRGEDAA